MISKSYKRKDQAGILQGGNMMSHCDNGFQTGTTPLNDANIVDSPGNC